MSTSTSVTEPGSPLCSPAEPGGAAVASNHGRWFHEEVHAHESALKSYLRGAFPKVRDVDDVVQESYLRIWKARFSRPIASTKNFLFQIARHLVIDDVRRRQTARTDFLGNLAELPVMEERPNAVETLSYDEKVGILGEALASLPPRCREIMILRKFNAVPHAEIARRLDISVRTVESQVTRGMKLIEARLRAQGIDGYLSDETSR